MDESVLLIVLLIVTCIYGCGVQHIYKTKVVWGNVYPLKYEA